MKMVSLNIWVLNIHSDGDTYSYLFKSHQEAIDHLYENEVKPNWSDYFEEEDIDDYSDSGAIDHYYQYQDGSYYDLNSENVIFTVAELQDEIAKAIGLATHG